MQPPNLILQSKYGCWICAGTAFASKLEACKFSATNGNADVKFYYHNHIWESFDKTLLGKVPLCDLYLERAQQLRDKYDHLVLHYSGGADSHNILHTFLSNNIKLDEICVKWAKPLVDGKFYTPNTLDKSARNAASEWDFVIKPVLDKLACTHPGIKITIVDFMDSHEMGHNVSFSENRIIEMNASRGALGTYMLRMNPNVEDAMGKKHAGHIFGIEKPLLLLIDDRIYFQFADTSLEPAIMIRGQNENSVELFYWTPDLPLLPMEQAYQSALFIDRYVKERSSVLSAPGSGLPTSPAFVMQSKIHKAVLYADSWDESTFQVGKPNPDRSDWYHWIHETPELCDLVSAWKIAMNNVTSGIHRDKLIHHNGVSLLAISTTRPFHILSLTK